MVPSGWAANKPGIAEMLGAFFGPRCRDWWLSYVEDPTGFMLPHGAHWLVRQSAARAFSQGLVRLDRRQPSLVEASSDATGSSVISRLTLTGRT